MGKELTQSIFSTLVVPKHVSIPESADKAREVLDGVGGIMSAGHWGTAAIVWAWTEDGQGSNQHKSSIDEKSSKLSLSDFAAKGIRGLSTRDSVRKYRNRWQEAIDEGLAEPTEPGQMVTLPAVPFKVEKPAVEKQEEPDADESDPESLDETEDESEELESGSADEDADGFPEEYFDDEEDEPSTARLSRLRNLLASAEELCVPGIAELEPLRVILNKWKWKLTKLEGKKNVEVSHAS